MSQRKLLLFKLLRVNLVKSAALRLAKYKLNISTLYTNTSATTAPSTIFNYNELAGYTTNRLIKQSRKTSNVSKRPMLALHNLKNHSYKALLTPANKIKGWSTKMLKHLVFRPLTFKRLFHSFYLPTTFRPAKFTLNMKRLSLVKLHNPVSSFVLNYTLLGISTKKKLLTKTSNSVFKKITFSFLKKNQLRKDVIMRKQRVNLYRYISSLSSNLLSNDLITNLALLNSAGNTNPPHSSRDLSMQRIRFKPGYRRLWKESRLVLADLLDIKYEFQHQFTKYLSKFYRKANFYNFSHNELKAINIILHSKLLPDTKSVKVMFSNGMIFLNGIKVCNLNSLIMVNDVIQLHVSSWFYTYSKWLLAWSNSRSKKLRRLIYRKVNLASMQNYRAKKQRSYHTPAWVHNAEHDLSDIKHYLEVDFFTLSIVVVYDNSLTDFYSNATPTSNKQHVYKLYNWKYIN